MDSLFIKQSAASPKGEAADKNFCLREILQITADC